MAALDLNAKGVKATIVERRSFGTPPEVKANHVSARTMEYLRRLGLAEKVRQAGLPPNHPHDVAFKTTITGTEFARISIPSSADRYTGTDGPDTDWSTPEPAHRINQTYFEPILESAAARADHITLLNDTEYLGFSQTEGGVSARAQR